MAIGEVVRGMGDLQYNAGADMKDLIFLRSLLENPVMHRIVRTHDTLDPNQQTSSSTQYNNYHEDSFNQHDLSSKPRPMADNLETMSASVANDLEPFINFYKDAKFVYSLLKSPEFVVSYESLRSVSLFFDFQTGECFQGSCKRS